jgi:hypothetical protein
MSSRIRPALLLFAMLAFCASLVSAQTPALPAKENFHLFLLVGQSNMAGRGVVGAEDKIPNARVLMLNKAGEWVPAVDPMHFDKPVAGVGLGRTFAEVVAEANPGVTIGLIPCAVGGSPIDTWKPGAIYPETMTYPWDDAIKRAKAALAVGTLKGILWHQGESDAKVDLAPAYEAKLVDLVGRFRREVNAPNVPFILGALGQFDGAPWNDFQKQVDRAHRDLANKVPYAAYVGSEGLKDKGDKIHFDTPSFKELGRRYGAAYLKLVGKK